MLSTHYIIFISLYIYMYCFNQLFARDIVTMPLARSNVFDWDNGAQSLVGILDEGGISSKHDLTIQPVKRDRIKPT